MKHVVTHRLYDYWSHLRGKRPAPERREIEPSDIRDILGYTFILEVGDLETYPFRLAGTRMCSAFCRELKEQDFLRLWNAKDRDPMATLLAAISNDGAAAVIGFEGRTETGKALPFELLLLPLRQGGDGFQRVLGSCTPFEQPYWLGTQPVISQTITSVRLIWPDEKPYFLRRAEEMRDNRKVIPYPDVGGPSRRYRHLTIYDGGRH